MNARAQLNEWCQSHRVLAVYGDFKRPGTEQPAFSSVVSVDGATYNSEGHFKRKHESRESAACVALAHVQQIRPSRPRHPPCDFTVDINNTPNCYVYVDCDGCGDIWKVLYDSTPAPYASYDGYGNAQCSHLPSSGGNFRMHLATTMRRDIAEYMLARDVWKLIFNGLAKSPSFRIIIVSKDAALENLVLLLDGDGVDAHFVCSLERLYEVFDTKA